MARVERAADLKAAWQAATQLGPVAFAEPWITGGEYTVGILQGAALPSIRIETPRAFYDYEAKYFRDDTRYFCPAGLAEEAEEQLRALALAAFEACGAEGWGRADFMMDPGGTPLLLEINTVPGSTDHSRVALPADAPVGRIGGRAAQLGGGPRGAGHRAAGRRALERIRSRQRARRSLRQQYAFRAARTAAALRPQWQCRGSRAALPGPPGRRGGGRAPSGRAAPRRARRLGAAAGQRRGGAHRPQAGR